MKVNRRSLFTGVAALVAQALLASIVLAQDGPEIREYSAENGYKIAITSRGNIIGLEIPERVERTGPREGYVLSYVDGEGVTRVVHDVYDSYSAVIRPGARDFVQRSFIAPPSQHRIPLDTLISATAVVDTQDGLLRLENEIRWRAGTGVVQVRMTITNRSATRSVRVINVKRVSAPVLGPDTHLMSVTMPDLVSFMINKCNCPPPIPPPPWALPEIIMRGDRPSNVLQVLADDDYDLHNVESGRSLGDLVTGINTQGVIVFQINSLIAPQELINMNISHEAQ